MKPSTGKIIIALGGLVLKPYNVIHTYISIHIVDTILGKKQMHQKKSAIF